MKFRLLISAAMAAGAVTAAPAQAQNDYIGELRLFAGLFCPRDWTEANGQILAIGDNPALFSLIGTTYGGDGRSTFGLPDLKSRAPVGYGQGPGLSNYLLGQMTGVNDVTFTAATMPQHSHTLYASSSANDTNTPDGNSFGAFAGPAFAQTWVGGGTFSGEAVSTEGSTSPEEVPLQQPALNMRWCIHLNGLYPPRN